MNLEFVSINVFPNDVTYVANLFFVVYGFQIVHLLATNIVLLWVG